MLKLIAPGKEFHFFIVVGTYCGIFREKAHPARITPGQHHKAFFQKLLLHPRTHLFAHVINFLPVLEHQRHRLQRSNRWLNLAQTNDGQQAALQLADSHATHHVGLAALTAIGINQIFGASALRCAPGLAHFHQLPVIERIFWGQRADPQLFISGQRVAGQ